MEFVLLIAIIIIIPFSLFVAELRKVRKAGIVVPAVQILNARSHGLKLDEIIQGVTSSKAYGLEISIPFLVLIYAEGFKVQELIEAFNAQRKSGESVDLFIALEAMLCAKGVPLDEATKKAFDLYKWNCCYTGDEIPQREF